MMTNDNKDNDDNNNNDNKYDTNDGGIMFCAAAYGDNFVQFRKMPNR